MPGAFVVMLFVFYLVVVVFTALVCLLLMLDADRRERDAQLKPVERSPSKKAQHLLGTIVAALALGGVWPTLPFVLWWSNARRKTDARIRAAEARIRLAERRERDGLS